MYEHLQWKKMYCRGFKANTSTCIRAIASQIGISYKSVWRFLHYEKMYLFHMQKVQQLSLMDYVQWVDFVRRLLDATENDLQFLKIILVSDAARFTTDSMVNTHTWAHMGTYESSHFFPVERETEIQCELVGRDPR